MLLLLLLLIYSFGICNKLVLAKFHLFRVSFFVLGNDFVVPYTMIVIFKRETWTSICNYIFWKSLVYPFSICLQSVTYYQHHSLLMISINSRKKSSHLFFPGLFLVFLFGYLITKWRAQIKSSDILQMVTLFMHFFCNVPQHLAMNIPYVNLRMNNALDKTI